MNRLLTLSLFSLSLSGTIVAMSSEAKKLALEGLAAMEVVYEAMQKNFESSTFSLKNVQDFEEFPTLSTRDEVGGAKLQPGQVRQGAKSYSLIYFLQEKFGQKAATFIGRIRKTLEKDGYIEYLKDQISENPASVEREIRELEQADGLLALIHCMVKLRDKLNTKPDIDKALEDLQFSRLDTIIAAIKAEPSRRAAEKAQLEKERRAREERQAEEKELQRQKEEAERKKLEETAALIREAKELYDSPEGARKSAPLMRMLRLFEAKMNRGKLSLDDYNAIKNHIWFTYDEAQEKGGRAWSDIHFHKLTILRFFNDGFHRSALSAINDKIDQTTFTRDEELHVRTVQALINEACHASMSLNEPLINCDELRQCNKHVEQKGFNTLNVSANRTALEEKLHKKELAFASLDNGKRERVYALHSDDVRTIAGAYGVPAIIDGSDTILLLGGSINDRINAIDPVLEAQNPPIEGDSFDDFKRLLQESKTKTSAFIMLDAADAKCSLTAPKWLSELGDIVKPDYYMPGNNLTLLVSKTGDTISYRLYDKDSEYPVSDTKQAEITAFFMPAKKNTHPSDKGLDSGTGSGAGSTPTPTPHPTLHKSFWNKLFNWKVIAPVTCLVAAVAGVFFWQKYANKKPTPKKTA